jgi:predicted transcriptional regulator YdeE
MDIRFEERDAFSICGYAVETNAENNDSDIGRLYDDYFGNGKDAALSAVTDQKGYYGLSWYTVGHERYCYLLGREAAEDVRIPEGAELKRLNAALYAVAAAPKGTDILKAWTDFFYTDIPKAGYGPDEAHGFYFEYYPESVYGGYELWVPVKKAEV